MNTKHDELSRTQTFLQCDDGDCAMFFYLEPSRKHGPIYRRHVRVMFLDDKSYAPAKTIVSVCGSSDDNTPQAELFTVLGPDSFLPTCEKVIQMLRVLNIARGEKFVDGESLAVVVDAFTVDVAEAMAS